MLMWWGIVLDVVDTTYIQRWGIILTWWGIAVCLMWWICHTEVGYHACMVGYSGNPGFV